MCVWNQEGERMARQRTGSIFKRTKGKKTTWWARITYTDDHGKRRDLQRRAENMAHAKEIQERLVSEHDTGGARVFETENKTFAQLCAYYEERYLIEAVYQGERKVAGLRDAQKQRYLLVPLKRYFGQKRLRSLTYDDLRAFRLLRLKSPTRDGRTRSIASVNREMALLRRMLNVAQAEGWLIRNPFKAGESLISIADEKQRERILTPEEESRLLAACTGRRSHLRAIIIAALDTGCRRGELLKLKWSDVEFDSRTITIQAFNTKTMRERQLTTTTRLYLELEKLWQASDRNCESLVFGIHDNVKHAFTSVRSKASLPDLRFHDLRHTAATRLVSCHISLPEVGRVLGHTQPQTTYRYTNLTSETAKRAASALESFGLPLATAQSLETVN
jgi:integrase